MDEAEAARPPPPPPEEEEADEEMDLGEGATSCDGWKGNAQAE